MFIQTNRIFVTFYNNKVPNWKRISNIDLIKNTSLNETVESIHNFILDQNLDPERLVNSIVNFYLTKNKRYPNILLFKGRLALSIYNNYSSDYSLCLTDTQKIRVSVKKSVILLKNILKNGIIYYKGVNLLAVTEKADPYFLLAHGITEGVSKQIIKKWRESEELKKLVLDVIFS